MNTENQNTETESNNAGASAMDASVRTQPKASRRSRFTVIAGVVIVLVAGLALGVIPRVRAQTKLAATSQEVTHQTVVVTNASRLATSVQLALPGDVLAFEQTKIYARADGYLLKWNTDIGAKVEAGQVLAEIDSPELDQELNQSRATLAQAQANLVLARSSAERWLGLLKTRAVSQQEVDEKTGALAAREADVKAAEAAVLRLEKLASFKEVRAPFAGTVTRRFVDTGALIRAGSSASALFELAQMDTFRVHVNVPQAYLRDITTGSPVQVRVAEYPDRTFDGNVLRTSGAFDPTTRTMLTEIVVPNRDGVLFPGIHVDVQLSLALANPPLVVPATAVIIRSDGLQVAMVDDNDAIRLQKVQIGRDLGRSVEIVSGLSDSARIVTNPTDTLANGVQVKIAGYNHPNLLLISRAAEVWRQVIQLRTLMKNLQKLGLALATGGLTANLFAAVGPDYHRPSAPTPTNYTDIELGTWKEALPADAIARGNWWSIFNDPVLDDLERQAAENNQDLKAAVARVTQARALARDAKADFFPSLTLDPSMDRRQQSANALNPVPNQLGNNFRVPVDLSYELDLWGRVRRSFEGANADAQAQLAAFENTLLLLKADVAQNYFALRTLDTERVILRNTIQLRREALDLVNSRFQGGAASELDVSRAETELNTTEAELLAVDRRRAQVEHALAVLVGTTASEFAVKELPLDAGSLPPVVPAGLPSELLERRPDIAEAERLLAAANARIGVAKAAFFPVVRVTGLAGYESLDVETLFNWQSRVWSIGPSITLPLFQGGRNRANLKRSQAVFEENVANYRQRVLIAFKEVQDALTGARLLSQQAEAENRSRASARKTADLSNTRYLAGLVSYLDVVDSERTALSADRESARIVGQRLVTSVQLIKALGGGWTIPAR